MRKEDKNNLIIVAAMLAFIALVVVFYFGTLHIPLIWIGVAFIIIPFIQIAFIIKDYLNFYQMDSKTWMIPIMNIISSSTPMMAGVLIANVAIIIAYILCWFVPAEWLLNINMEFPFIYTSTLKRLLPIMIIGTYVIIGIAYDMIWADIRSLIFDATRQSTPKLVYVFYLLMLIPVLNVLSLTQVASDMKKLGRLGYSFGEEQETVLEEI